MIKADPTPSPFMAHPMAVALFRSLTGNHMADNNGAAPIATGPANPFRIDAMFISLERQICAFSFDSV